MSVISYVLNVDSGRQAGALVYNLIINLESKPTTSLPRDANCYTLCSEKRPSFYFLNNSAKIDRF